MKSVRVRTCKSSVWQKLARLISGPRGQARYHPEAHYMRGPGPKTLAKFDGKASYEEPWRTGSEGKD